MNNTNTNTILIVDDSDTNIDILTNLLDNEYDIMVAIDGNFALEMIDNNIPDLILLDIMMPSIDGYEVCRRLKAKLKTKDIPIMFITAKYDEDSIEKAYSVGGIDYIAKPFKPKELLARVKTQLTIRQLIYDLKKSKEELKLLSSVDYLTKLYNRRYFSKVSEDIIHLAIRDKTPTSIIMIDIDKFKNINDTYGHKIGDEVIINLSNTLKELTRTSDIVCRYGGEEFVILLPQTSLIGAEIIANKIKNTIELISLEIPNNKIIKYTVSLGVSESQVEDSDIEVVLKRADDALYEAKNSGRNKVCVNTITK